MTELSEVVITAPDPEWLFRLTRALVADGLCASAHNFTPCGRSTNGGNRFTSAPKAGHRSTPGPNSSAGSLTGYEQRDIPTRYQGSQHDQSLTATLSTYSG
jgi:hypothetical protein